MRAPRARRARSEAAASGEALPVAIILRSRTERLRFLRPIQAALGVTGLIAVLLATGISYGIARTITRPLGAITSTMKEIAATGDLTRKIAWRAGRWEDEDARLLIRTFNTLTDSIARFQREAAERERLSALGRLSTVIAHEVRNPLMIIKASLQAARPRAGVRARTIRDAVADIDEEVRAAEPARQRRARLRAADPLRARADRREPGVRGLGGRGDGGPPGRARAPRCSTRRCRRS